MFIVFVVGLMWWPSRKPAVQTVMADGTPDSKRGLHGSLASGVDCHVPGKVVEETL